MSIAGGKRQAIGDWLARGATAWHNALEPLTPDQRRIVVATLRAYEREMTG